MFFNMFFHFFAPNPAIHQPQARILTRVRGNSITCPKKIYQVTDSIPTRVRFHPDTCQIPMEADMGEFPPSRRDRKKGRKYGKSFYI